MTTRRGSRHTRREDTAGYNDSCILRLVLQCAVLAVQDLGGIAVQILWLSDVDVQRLMRELNARLAEVKLYSITS